MLPSPDIDTRLRIRALIVDDEEPSRLLLLELLSNEPDIVVLGACASGAEAVTSVRRERPDVVFLDVQMPVMSGFEVLKQLGGEVPPAVVFVTAFEHYAVNAFEVHAVDYLL